MATSLSLLGLASLVVIVDRVNHFRLMGVVGLQLGGAIEDGELSRHAARIRCRRVLPPLTEQANLGVTTVSRCDSLAGGVEGRVPA